MKKNYLLALACLGWVLSVSAQKQFSGHVPVMANQTPAPFLKTAHLPQEQFLPEPENPNPVANPAVQFREEETAGLTRWDAQSYGAMPSRIYDDGNGNPVATWIFANDQASSPTYGERGTAYNVRTGGAWPAVDSRIEAIRTGFPAVARLDDGTEIVVAHTTSFTPYRIHVARKAAGSSTWVETDLENPAGAGCLWPRVAVGGPDGKTVHVIAITTPVANTGVKYEGVDGHLLYWRSLDGGQTWDKKHVIIPGLDQTKLTQLSADSYTLDANGENVGVVVFPDWNDLLLYKSIDNGENWEQSVVNDFPDALENYTGAAGLSYTIDDIGYVDPNTPDSAHLAIFTSDGFGSLLIDNDAQAHIWFGRMYVIDNDSTAANTFYYPGTNGLCYWKESYGSDNFRVITGSLDYDGDTSLTLNGTNPIAPYYNSLSSFASTGVDANGTIYLVYSAVHELYRSDWGAEVDQYYRHLYLMKSDDNGENWSDPYEITAPPYVSEDFVPYLECVWPALPRHIGSSVWVLYQQDGLPGTDLWGDNHSAGENAINFIEVPVDSIPAFVGVFNPPAPDAAFDLQLAPNPATSVTQLSVTLTAGQPALVEVFNLTGHLAQQFRLPNNGSGRQIMNLPVQNLPGGVYTVRVTQGGHFGVTKLLKH